MSEGTKRRLAAIVAADVVGYSRLLGADETGTLAALRAHRSELIDPKIAELGDRIVKTMGDGTQQPRGRQSRAVTTTESHLEEGLDIVEALLQAVLGRRFSPQEPLRLPERFGPSKLACFMSK